jgi:hypothetical protein
MTVAGRAMRVERAWGYELVWDMGGSHFCRLLHINRGHRLWLESRGTAADALMLCSGVLSLAFEDDRGDLRETRLLPGQVHEIPVKRRHRMIALEDCDVVTPTQPGLDDNVRVEDEAA